MDLQIFTKIEPVKETCIQSPLLKLATEAPAAVAPPAAPSAHSSDKKSRKNKDSKSSKSNKKKQNQALVGIGSQFDNDNDGAAGPDDSYPQDLVVD
ncbi:YIPF6 protein [Apiospora arundinis]